MALTPEQERLLEKYPPHMRASERTRMEIANEQGDPDDPPVWEFNNPFTAIWTGGDATKAGYNQKPSSKAQMDFYSLNRDELLRFQEMAFQAGLYGSGAEREDIPWKARDPETFKIWQQMVGQAARYAAAGKKNTIWDALQEIVDNRPEGLGKKQTKRQPLVTQLPDPREIEELVRGVAPSVIGRDVDEAFTQDFIAMYTEMVARFQKQKYDLEGSEEGGTITAPPSAEAIAAFRLRHERPEEFEEKRAASRQAAYTSLLKGANI
jgi:hypothetical protein